MSEWAAPNRNFYSLALCIFNPRYSADKALGYFGIKQVQVRTTEHEEVYKKRVKAPKFEIDREELRVLYEDKKIIQSEIAKMYGVTQNTISKKLRELGIETRDKKTAVKLSYKYRSKFNFKDFDRLINEGYPQKEIAKILNVSESTISKYKRERGFINE